MLTQQDYYVFEDFIPYNGIFSRRQIFRGFV